MALHKDFPKSPHEILNPEIRWFPADEDLRKQGYGKLLPPLVHKLRKEVEKWRDSHYQGVSPRVGFRLIGLFLEIVIIRG